jgi:hypothetical protein
MTKDSIQSFSPPSFAWLFPGYRLYAGAVFRSAGLTAKKLCGASSGYTTSDKMRVSLIPQKNLPGVPVFELRLRFIRSEPRNGGQ